MAVKIERKITGFEVAKPADQKKEPTGVTHAPEKLLQRPEKLSGESYKIKPPTCSAALYITINNITRADGVTVPFEMFINSKEMEHYQWVVALTRVISAVFRKGGDVTFLVEELKSVFDPKGGYWAPGGRFVPSLVADIGNVLEMHLIDLGLIKSELSEAQQKLIADKRVQFEAKNGNGAGEQSAYPAEATLCGKCHTKAVVKLDGCNTCLSCGDSKCG